MKNYINRRNFIKLGVLTILLFFINVSLLGQNHPSIVGVGINEQVYTFKVGEFECVCINDGDHYYLPGDFFKNVLKTELEDVLLKRNLPTESIYSPYTHLIVNTGKHKVLVDMGAGGNLPRNMKAAGIEPSDIDIVIITHAHPDHIGGTLDTDGNPTYPNAHYYIWKDEWDFWFSDTAFEKTFEFFINKAREQLVPVKDRMNFVDKDCEILPGIQLLAAPGHTPGHMVVSFSSGGNELYYIGDTVLNPLHLEHPDWLPIYDILPDKAGISKRKIFNLVAQKKSWVIGQHFPPFPSLGKVIKINNGWQWQPVLVDFPESPKHQIRIVVIPKMLPESSTIYITGNHSDIGNWQPGKILLVENNDGTWTGTFQIKENKHLEFKITRGSWETEAVSKDGHKLPNSTLDVKSDTTVTIIVENWKDLLNTDGK